MHDTALILAVIALLGIASQWLAWWLNLPAILFLLLIGVTLGPLSGLIDPDALLGDLLFPFVSLGVAVILFEGGLTLRWHEIRDHGSVVSRLVTLGVMVTWGVAATAAWWLIGFDWQLAALFGAVVTVTGPTVIGPLLRAVRPNGKLSNILRWEGILIDPIGGLLAVLVFEFIISGQQEGHALATFAKSIAVGLVSGGVGAAALGIIIKRHLMPDYLHEVAALSLVLGVFTLANSLAEESGLLAVTLMGIILANIGQLRITSVLNFKESLSVLMISLMFIVLAARIDASQLQQLGLNAWLVLGLIIFVARPVSVWISSLGSNLNWREQAFLAWIAPRGIVAAAVSALFALKLEQSGHAEADFLVPLTFLVITGTVVLQSLSAKRVAKVLKVSEPEPNGVLLIGANRVGLAFAEALKKQGIQVTLADSDWDNIRSARMAGFKTYFGNVTSEHAEQNLDLAGIGHVFAMTYRPALNALISLHFRRDFGANKVFAIRAAEEGLDDKHQFSHQHRGTSMFEENVTLSKLASLLSQGAQLRSTSLTDQFDWNTYEAQMDDQILVLFAFDEDKRLHVMRSDEELSPESGWEIISLQAAH